MPMDWDKLRIFHAVARAGSFTHAGEELNLSQSAVSRQISALEEELGVQLFHRHARGLILTEQGKTLSETARDVFERLSLAQVQIADSKAVPSGDLRVTSTVGFGSTWLTPRMREFIEIYPDINLSLICDDREMDLGMREADVAIRFSDPTQPDLIKRRLFTIRNHIYASDEYLATHAPIASIEDLNGHNIIAYGDNAPPSLRNVNWIRHFGLKGRAVRPVALQVNNIYGLLLSVEAGMGIASLPDYMVKGHPKLRQILPEVKGPEFDSYFVYPEELRNMKRLNVFRDFLIEKVKEWQNDEHGRH